jgi:hypothetical protein
MTQRTAAALSGRLLRGKKAVNLAPEQVPKLLATLASPARLEEDSARLRDRPGARHPFEKIPRRDAEVGAIRVLFDYMRRAGWSLGGIVDQFSAARRGGVPVDGATVSCVLKVCGFGAGQSSWVAAALPVRRMWA